MGRPGGNGRPETLARPGDGDRGLVLAMTLVVRDEQDILAANLDYHLSQGVDVILVVDHGSQDGTPVILAEYERTGRVHWVQDEERPHRQAERVNRLLATASDEYAADWVIHCDADEFWMPAAGSLRDVFAAIPDDYGWIQVARHSFLPARDDGEPFHRRMVIRPRRSLNLRGTALEPKVAQRPAAARTVTPGNHDLVSPVMEMAPDIGAVEVLHFQMRSFAQFERKVLRNGIGHELNPDRERGTGGDQLALLAMQRDDQLRARYDQEMRDPHQVQAGLRLGELVCDARLREFFEASERPRSRSPAFQAVLRRTWDSFRTSDHALCAAEARARTLEAQLEGSRRQSRELQRTLEVIRASRTQRYSAPARRAYHRLRTTIGV